MGIIRGLIASFVFLLGLALMIFTTQNNPTLGLLGFAMMLGSVFIPKYEHDAEHAKSESKISGGNNDKKTTD